MSEKSAETSLRSRPTLCKSIRNQRLLLFLFLQLQPILALQPALGRMILDVFTDPFFFDPRQELSDAADVVGLAFFRRMIAGWKVTERRSGCEEGEEVWREFVRHLRKVVAWDDSQITVTNSDLPCMTLVRLVVGSVFLLGMLSEILLGGVALKIQELAKDPKSCDLASLVSSR